MKKKHLLAFLLLAWVEGVAALGILLGMRFEAGRGHLLNYTSLKFALAGMIGLVLVALLLAIAILIRNAKWSQRLSAYLDSQMVGPKMRLFFIQGALLVTTVFLFEFFLLTYLAFPVPLRPVFFWGALICLQGWLALRIAYAKN